MGPSGHMVSTGIFPDSNTREFGSRRTTQTQPPRPTHKCNAPRLPFHVHLTHDLTRAASALPLHTAALAFVSFGIVLVQVQVHEIVVQCSIEDRDGDIKHQTKYCRQWRLPIPIWSEHFPGEFRPETLQVLTLSPLKRFQKVSAQSENFYFPLISSRSSVQYLGADKISKYST